MNLSREKGFSLVGILVGVSLLGILTLGMMQLFSNMMKGQNYNKFRSQVENFSEELRSQLGSKNICTATFKTLALDPLTSIHIPAIKDQTGNSLYKIGDDLGDHSFTINSMDLKSTATAPWYIEDDATTGTGRAILTVNYRATGEISAQKDYYRTYTLATHKDGTGKLIDCAALAKMSDGIWRYNKNTVADIYYTGGKVGIGTTDPAATFEVVGEIKLGNTSTTCGSDTEGQIRYNSTIHNVEFCNGTIWATLGGGDTGSKSYELSGTWSKPSSGTFVRVQCWGAGGGGGRWNHMVYNPYLYSASGGGGGGFATKDIPFSTLPATVAVTVGTGGVGSVPEGNGTPGGNSSFGAFLTATGGSGGIGLGNSSGDGGPNPGGGTGGGATVGSCCGISNAGVGNAGSNNGGDGGNGSLSANGSPGNAPGGGGGASAGPGAGGPGANGRCTTAVF